MRSHWANARRNRSALVSAVGVVKWALVAAGVIEIAAMFYVYFPKGLEVVAMLIAIILVAKTPSPTQVLKGGKR